ncbi:MAG: glycosyltransferase, partial [Akkermansia sp.]
MPKVSILVPIYNVERYLEQCLDSCINQSLADIEIICINDGSTDNCKHIIDDYASKDPRIKAIHKHNTGYGHSMNTGLDAATGEYIAIVESDDFAELEMCEELYNLAKLHDADLVKAEHFEFRQDGHDRIKTNCLPLEHMGKVLNIERDTFLLDYLSFIWDSLYKKEFLTQNKIHFHETPGASYQDLSFEFKVFCHSRRLVFSNQAYLNYRLDNANSSINSKAKVYCICDEYELLGRYFKENPSIKKLANTRKLLNQYKGYCWNLGRIDQQFHHEFVQHFSKTFKQLRDENELSDEFYQQINGQSLRFFGKSAINHTLVNILIHFPSLYLQIYYL